MNESMQTNVPNDAENEKALDRYGDLLTIEDLRRLTGISAQTLRAECRKGSIPSRKIGRRFFVSKKAFLASVLPDNKNQLG